MTASHPTGRCPEARRDDVSDKSCTHCYGRSANDRCLNCGAYLPGRAALAAAPQPAPDREGDAVAKAAKAILSQPKRPVGPVADAFGAACAYLSDRECGAETTNEIIETFLKALAGEDN